jgi:hypothetical protein
MTDETVRRLAERCARVERERDEARAELELADRRWALAADICDDLRALLREVEWAGCCWDEIGRACDLTWPFCPVCHEQQPSGHAPDCKLKAALEA